MKADGVEIRILDDVTGFTHRPKSVKKIKTLSGVASSNNNTNVDLSTTIEKADQTAANLGSKLQEMSTLLSQIKEEKSDIIREQLARFFNILKAYIDEALHPSGEWSVNQLMSGKTIKLNLETDGTAITLQGERITMDETVIHKLSKSPTSDDIDTMQQNIKKAQVSIKKLRDNLASYLTKSHGITL